MTQPELFELVFKVQLLSDQAQQAGVPLRGRDVLANGREIQYADGDTLVAEARRRGETVSDVLRRQIASLREARPDGTRTHKRKKAELRSRKLSLCLKKVSTNAAAVSNFRRILSCLHALNPKQFWDEVGRVSGPKRRYFAESRDELFRPKPIPNSPYWVEVNNSTGVKLDILRRVMNNLGYSPRMIQQATDKLS